MTSRALAFCRYQRDEMIVVIVSFEKEPLDVSLPLDELQLPIHHLCLIAPRVQCLDGAEKLTGLWNVEFFHNASTCMVRTACLLHF